MDTAGISKRLADLRGKMSQDLFSKQMQMSQDGYSKVEIGKRSITVKMIHAIKKHYGSAAVLKVLFNEDMQPCGGN